MKNKDERIVSFSPCNKNKNTEREKKGENLLFIGFNAQTEILIQWAWALGSCVLWDGLHLMTGKLAHALGNVLQSLAARQNTVAGGGWGNRVQEGECYCCSKVALPLGVGTTKSSSAAFHLLAPKSASCPWRWQEVSSSYLQQCDFPQVAYPRVRAWSTPTENSLEDHRNNK